MVTQSPYGITRRRWANSIHQAMYFISMGRFTLINANMYSSSGAYVNLRDVKPKLAGIK